MHRVACLLTELRRPAVEPGRHHGHLGAPAPPQGALHRALPGASQRERPAQSGELRQPIRLNTPADSALLPVLVCVVDMLYL